MAVYIIVTYNIQDQKAYEPYAPGVIPLLLKHGAEILAADFSPKKMEGDNRDVGVILKFPDETSAMNWYSDPEYAPLKKCRFDSCGDNHMYLLEEFVFPKS